MTTFAYVATDVNGKKVKGTEMAEDSVELIDKLRQKGLFCTSYKDAAKNKAADVKYKFKTKDSVVLLPSACGDAYIGRKSCKGASDIAGAD